MAWGFSSVSLFLFVVFNLVSGKIVLEEGYEVTTVVDGHKSGLNPYTIHALPGSSNLIVLDSSGSTFYTTSFPLSVDSVINRFAGDGSSGHVDGKAGNSRFSKPRGFAVDAKGNVYVADKSNKAIRKISSSGSVTTIAGGISKAFGHRDGPAQNATFSSDFEITFVPQRCCLLVSDHGNEMIRQINLKEEDCLENSHSSIQEEVNHLSFIMTWKLLLTKLGEQVLTFFSYIRNRVAESTVYSVLSRLVMMIVSHLSLMYSALSSLICSMVSSLFFMCQPNNVAILDKTVSVSDPESPGCGNPKPPLSLKPSDDLIDLISFDDEQEPNNDKDCRNEETLPHATIDDIIKVHVEEFSKMAEEDTVIHGSSSTE
ncbi:T23E23.6 [Arabidopsis thaliana]|uniref:T23E23.6 n=1 Tax=Arabidopsis thaliana TaxID=3702 RepID=Q9LRA4_ARATH|nr:T23E23.6 [Arabidopsis thaliana]